jgi:hypothetical protein
MVECVTMTMAIVAVNVLAFGVIFGDYVDPGGCFVYVVMFVCIFSMFVAVD